LVNFFCGVWEAGERGGRTKGGGGWIRTGRGGPWGGGYSAIGGGGK